jgi:serine/threonine-protein kinase
VVAIIASAAAALHHAHEQRGSDGAPLGIVHRQVTPSNILIGFDGNVKIVDFGIAKAAIKRIQTGVGVLKGSAPYMAPEQCAGRTIDRRSDVFALGIVLYELATVRRLFKGANEFLTMSAVVNAEVPRPSQYRRDVPSDLEVVMLKALARDPLARYQTAADMANALDKIARSVGVGPSTSGLANYMKVQFGERKEPWLEPDVEVDLEATQIDFDGDASGLAPPSSEALKSNSIPKMVAATKSSPIAQARTVVITPAIRAKTPSAAQTLPMDKSFSVATTVDDPEPASSRQSTEVGDEDVEESAATKNDLPVSVGPPPKAPGTIALRVPVATPAGPAPTIALKLPGTPPPARPPATIALKLPAASPPAGGGSQAAVAPPVSPASIESERSFARSVITDATAIVEPLAVVVARAQTVTQSRSRKMQYIGGGAAVVAAIILAIVLWPPSDHTTGSSAAPAVRPEPEATPEPEVETPQKSALDMTARDYEAARSDAGVAAEVAPEVDGPRPARMASPFSMIR